MVADKPTKLCKPTNQSKGGRARFAKMTPEQRHELATTAARKRWGTRDVAARFWEKVTKSDDGCWPWTGGVYQYGYGSFYWNRTLTSRGGMRQTHRVAYELTYGPIPDSLQVLHRCDNPPCCRPDHLFLGTDATNSADKVQKRRHAFGETQTLHKLTDADVRVIRAEATAGVMLKTLAERFNVARPTIFMAVHRRTWKHVE